MLTVWVSKEELEINELESASYQVALNSEPTGNVTVTPSSSCIDEHPPMCTLSGPLVFTPENWNVRQTVTFQSIEDVDTDDSNWTIENRATGANYVEGSVVSPDVGVDSRRPR